jgi:hypothetical protein
MSTQYNPSTQKVKITKKEITKVCTRYNIPKYHYGCYLKFANEAKISTKEFGRRLHQCANYKRATLAVMCWLSQSTWHLFDYNRPALFDKVQRIFAKKNTVSA